ncbi:sister chromatid cohesion 1 protein 3 isoform X1 [Carica papaya]|uniref:sister chromatid cohesion 1 protein 3 isoform X1 n=1 Tax=Carica papaya TaxID=3649 RepID=UPI000B8C8E63|nr:sister chromatid cohesion 1 protein 3 isoform X1 [Carica papaya]
MFYSHTFLARKGPLGTVWLAAHLQHRLKKSHYTSTDIPATADLIMFPEVPIALRMSGHLLLGLVRIYSKKVDYLFQECNIVLTSLRKAFASVELNLPEDARQAPVESITLPETLNLDAFDFDEDIDYLVSNDHLKSQEDITLTDQIPMEGDPYIVITFDEDMIDVSHPVEFPDSGVRPMHVDVRPTTPVDGNINNQREETYVAPPVQDAEPSNQLEVPNAPVDSRDPTNEKGTLNSTLEVRDSGASNQTDIPDVGSSHENLLPNPPDIEIMRDAAHDLSHENVPPHFPDNANDTTEPTGSFHLISNEKRNLSPISEDMLASGGEPMLFQQYSEPPPSAASREALDTHVSFGISSPELALRPSPAVQSPQRISSPEVALRPSPSVQQPHRRGRKRKLFDKSTVLTNRFMKQALEDSSYLLRERKTAPFSSLGLWRLKNIRRKEQVLSEPLITGFSADLCDIFKKDYISSRSQLAVVEEPISEQSPIPARSPSPITEAVPEPSILQTPDPLVEVQFKANARLPDVFPENNMHTNDIEIELLRAGKGDGGNSSLPDFMTSAASSMPSPGAPLPSLVASLPSPFRTDIRTPPSMSSLGEGGVPQAGTSGTGVLPTPDFSASTAPYGSDLETPRTFLEGGLGIGSTGLSNILELEEDLSFLEAENNTPTDSQASQGVGSLSARTRAVAQHLKSQSGDLSLNKILEGKTRKVCARMFFETLVLKNHGLVDVQQDHLMVILL